MTGVPLAANKSPLEIARASGSNFLVSFAFLSPGRRRGLLAVYAFCRVVDEVVDEAAARGAIREPAEREAADAQLRFWEEELAAAFAGRPGTPLGYALHRAAERFGIDAAPLQAVVDGVRCDLEPPCYESFDALRGYMSKVASAVGLACLPVFGADERRCAEYATVLGHALQYTNILRDLAEDGALGRCYVPRQELRRHGLEPADLLPSAPPERRAPDGPLARLLCAETARAAALFARSHELLEALPASDRRALRPARMMGRIYQELLERVRALGPELTAAPRVRVSKLRKLRLALSAIF